LVFDHSRTCLLVLFVGSTSPQVTKIKSPALNKALLGIYVGDSPVSETAKVNFGLGLAGLLSE